MASLPFKSVVAHVNSGFHQLLTVALLLKITASRLATPFGTQLLYLPLEALLSHIQIHFARQPAVARMSAEWVWDQFPIYRLDRDIVLKFLKEKFPDYGSEDDFEVYVGAPRALKDHGLTGGQAVARYVQIQDSAIFERSSSYDEPLNTIEN